MPLAMLSEFRSPPHWEWGLLRPQSSPKTPVSHVQKQEAQEMFQ